MSFSTGDTIQLPGSSRIRTNTSHLLAWLRVFNEESVGDICRQDWFQRCETDNEEELFKMLLPTLKKKEGESKPCREMRPVMPQGGECTLACAVVSVYARWGIGFTLHFLYTSSFVQICARVLGFVDSPSFDL